MDKLIRSAFVNAISTVLYVVIVVLFMTFMQSAIPPQTNTIIIPIAMLLLFVFSAGFTGMLVFGKPVMLYVDGKKKQAVSLIVYTLGFLLIITLLVFVFLIGYFNLIN